MILSPRQMQVLELLSFGLTYKQIGARLFIAPTTVKGVVSILIARLDAPPNGHGVVAAAFRKGLLK